MTFQKTTTKCAPIKSLLQSGGMLQNNKLYGEMEHWMMANKTEAK